MINFTNVSFDYPKKKLFTDLSFELAKWRVYGLLGENGTGKTTIINLICGTLFAKNGVVSVNGKNSKDRLASMYENMYLIPEEFQLPSIYLASFIKAYAPFYPNFSHERMTDYIARFKVDINTRLDKMSMGQRKKALISFGFATGCSVMLLDEPTNGLDIPSKSVFRSMIAEIANEDRIIIISTHQIRDLDMLLDSVMILDDNNLVLNTTITEIEDKLYFGSSNQMENVLYSDGGLAVRKNTNADESVVNIEILFNAFINNKEEFSRIFNK